MTKKEYLSRLEEALFGLSREEISERLNFYSEMIDDRMEEGLSEEEAVAQIGPVVAVGVPAVEDLPGQAEEDPSADTPPEAVKPAAERPKRNARDIVLLILGFPLWFPLLIAAAAFILSLLILLWAVVIVFWAVFAALPICAAAGLGLGIRYIVRGDGTQGLAVIGAALTAAGLAVYLYFGCKALTRASAGLTLKILSGVKKFFRRKESKK